jgi:hypothetical protein
MAKVNPLPARSSGRLQSPTLRFGDGSQSTSGEELSTALRLGEAAQSALTLSACGRPACIEEKQ